MSWGTKHWDAQLKKIAADLTLSTECKQVLLWLCSVSTRRCALRFRWNAETLVSNSSFITAKLLQVKTSSPRNSSAPHQTQCNSLLIYRVKEIICIVPFRKHGELLPCSSLQLSPTPSNWGSDMMYRLNQSYSGGLEWTIIKMNVCFWLLNTVENSEMLRRLTARKLG